MDRRLVTVDINLSIGNIEDIKKKLACEVVKDLGSGHYVMYVPDCSDTYKYLSTGPFLNWEFSNETREVDKTLMDPGDENNEVLLTLINKFKSIEGVLDTVNEVYGFLGGVKYMRQRSPALKFTKRFIEEASKHQWFDRVYTVDDYIELTEGAVDIIYPFVLLHKESIGRYIYDGLKASWDEITKDKDILQITSLIFLGTDDPDSVTTK